MIAKLQTRPRIGLLLVLTGIVLGGGCTRSVRREIAIEYTPKPDKGEILRTDPKNPIRICVNTIEVRSEYTENDPRSLGPTTTISTFRYLFGMQNVPTTAATTSVVTVAEQDRHSKQLENLVLSRVKAKLKEGADAEGKSVILVDRDAMKAIIREEDLKNAGHVEADKEKIKQLGVDLFVFGTIDVSMQIDVSYKRDTGARIINHLPYVPDVFDGDPKRQIRRTITFAGNLRAVDAKTGEQFFLQDFASQDLADAKPIPFVGTGKDRTDLVPEQRVVKLMMEEASDLFVSRLVKTRVRHTVIVESSRNTDCVEGVKQLRADAGTALTRFEKAMATDPNDEKAVFGAGVALECLRRLPEACEKYQLAKDISEADDDDQKGQKGQYVAACKRIRERIERGEATSVVAVAKPSVAE